MPANSFDDPITVILPMSDFSFVSETLVCLANLVPYLEEPHLQRLTYPPAKVSVVRDPGDFATRLRVAAKAIYTQLSEQAQGANPRIDPLEG